MGREKGHREEELNLRSFYLRLIRKIWLLPLSMLIGALLGGGIYYMATVVYGPARTYSAQSILYLTFAYDETGTVYDYYNAYTWNQLIQTDDIMNETMAGLALSGVTEISEKETGAEEADAAALQVTRSEVMESMQTDLPSDIRVMTLTVTNEDPALAELILSAADRALVKYGETQDVFTRIDVRSTSEAALVTYTDRTLAAVITGMFLTLLIAILALLLIDVLDDAIYVPEDGQRRYGIPCLGMLPPEGNTQNIYRNDLLASFGHLISPLGRVAVMSMRDKAGTRNADRQLQVLLQNLGSDFDGESTQLETVAVPDTDLETFRRMHNVDGVILLIRAGAKDGTRVDRVLSQLRKHDCKALGFVLTDIDMRFMKRYYREK